jgi:hypothetical protein
MIEIEIKPSSRRTSKTTLELDIRAPAFRIQPVDAEDGVGWVTKDYWNPSNLLCNATGKYILFYHILFLHWPHQLSHKTTLNAPYNQQLASCNWCLRTHRAIVLFEHIECRYGKWHPRYPIISKISPGAVLRTCITTQKIYE